MGKTWYHRIFSRSTGPVRETVRGQAERGIADAQYEVGLTFANDLAGTPDYAQAAEWYLKAAEQNHCLAQFNLGVMHSKGQGMPRNDAQSAIWIGKAANQGDAGAQYVLGMKHLRDSFEGEPLSIIESKIEAYKWLHLAAAQGYRGSDIACNSLTFSMTTAAVTEGIHRISGFHAVRTQAA